MKTKIILWAIIIILISALCLTFCQKQDIETATIEDFEKLDDIGEILSERLVAYIVTNNVTDVNKLIEVEGIGEKRLKTIKKEFD